MMSTRATPVSTFAPCKNELAAVLKCVSVGGADYNVKAEEAAGVALLGSKTIARYLQTELLAAQAAGA